MSIAVRVFDTREHVSMKSRVKSLDRTGLCAMRTSDGFDTVTDAEIAFVHMLGCIVRYTERTGCVAVLASDATVWMLDDDAVGALLNSLRRTDLHTSGVGAMLA